MDILRLINKKIVIIIGILVLIIVITLYTAGYINSQQYITVKYKNISKVTIQKFKQGTKGAQDKIVIPKSGLKIKVPKGNYLLKYTGNAGYASDYENINIGDKSVSISFDPDYSEEKLINMLDQDFENIKIVLNTKYQNMRDYSIEKGKLYKKGKWYSTTLQYNGNDMFNYDTLRLVMVKEEGSWKLVTNPPSIIISHQAYPSIPMDILKDLNNTQNTSFSEKYTDSSSRTYFP